MKADRPYHRPVLLAESLGGLALKKDGVYVDATFGGGGHSRELLKRLGPEGKLIAFDQDGDALANAIHDDRFTLINENFRYLKRFLRFYGITEVNGVLADLGVSSHQFDEPGRGFSTRFDGVLDMRMDVRHEKAAFDIVNTYPEEALAQLLFEFGELRNARALARAIGVQRSKAAVKTTNGLNGILRPLLPKGRENKLLAQVYQAIRIEVNDEIGALKEFLQQLPQVLAKGGRLCVISYHSLEDRLAKRFIRDGKFEGQAEKDFYGNIDVPLKKVGGLVVPSKEELDKNNRARSAKLRIAERL